MQALLFAALLANARAHVDGDRFFAPVAAGLLGLLLFLRFDAVLGDRRRRRRAGARLLQRAAAARSFLAPLRRGALRLRRSTCSDRCARTPSCRSCSSATCRRGSTWCSAAVAGGGRLGLWLAATIAGLQRTRRRAGHQSSIAAALWVLALYALFFRHPGGKLADHDAYALRTFTNFYLTLPALLAALIGLRAARARAFWRDPALFVTVAIFACFFFYKIRIVPDHFWMARRFLPVILPGALLFAARGGSDRRRGAAAGSASARSAVSSASSSSRCSRFSTRAPAGRCCSTSSTRASSRGSSSSPERSATTTS